MLSTKPIKNVTQARFYFYEKDNYYFKDSPQAQELSQWEGRGAQALGLAGQVGPEVFEKLLQGSLPNGTQLGKRVGQEIHHRPGYDLTFNAPKSVSLMAYVGGDPRLIAAHQDAVRKTLQYVERTCAQARVTQEGVLHYENTRNLVFATFLQDVSRALDPHLHTHCVTMNATQRDDGAWRALASQMPTQTGVEVNGFWERVREFQRFLGFMYRAELAYQVKQLGYDIEKQEKDFWQIKGVTASDIDLFSKRRHDIEKYMNEQGMEGARAASYATLMTRHAKKSVERVELQEQWRELAKTDFTALIAQSKDKQKAQEKQEIYQNNSKENLIPVVEKIPENAAPFQSQTLASERAKQAVEFALLHLSETKTRLHEMELLNTALRGVIGEDVAIDDIVAAIGEAQKAGTLIPLSHRNHLREFTTQHLLRYEQETLQVLFQGQNKFHPLVDDRKLAAYFGAENNVRSHEKEDLRAAMKTMFTSCDQIVGIDLRGEQHKGELYRSIKALAKLGKYKVLGISLNAQKADNLCTTYGLDRAETLKHFVARIQMKEGRYPQVDGKNVLVVVEDAEQLSAKEMQRLTTIAEKTHVRLALVFDQKSPLAIGAGSPVLQMMQHGMTMVTVDKIKKIERAHTQKAAGPVNKKNKIMKDQTSAFNNIQGALQDTLANNLQAAFHKIKNNIIEIHNEEARFTQIARHYTQLDVEERHNTAIIMATNAQSQKLNALIHQQLKENRFFGQGPKNGRTSFVMIEALLPVPMTQVSFALASQYQVGQWVRFNETYRSLQSRRGDYLQIAQIQARQNKIILKKTDGTVIEWRPDCVAGKKEGAIELFHPVQKEMGIGEIIVIKRNHPAKHLISGDRYTVTDIKANQLIVKNADNKKIQLALNEPGQRHIDYGYASTHYQQKDITDKNIIAHQSSQAHATTQRKFYYLLSHANKKLSLYTDNQEQYLERIKTNSGDKRTVLSELNSASELAFDRSLLEDKKENLSDFNALDKKIQGMVLALIQKYGREKITNPQDIAKESVSFALAYCAEKEAAFTHKEIIETALRHSLGDTQPELIEKAVRDAEDNNQLLRGKFVSNGTQWTTPEALERERFILDWAKQGQRQSMPIATPQQVQAYLAAAPLKEEQKRAIHLMATHSDRLVLIQGMPGTGKTTLLRATAEFMQHMKQDIYYLAPTHTAVRELCKEGLSAQTLQKFLVTHRYAVGPINTLNKTNTVNNPQNSTETKTPLYVVDESSFVSNQQVKEFFTVLDHLNGRAVLVGDRKQIPAIEAGKPSTLLEWDNTKTSYLSDIQRQKDPQLLKAVKAAHTGQFHESFALLKQNFITDKELIRDFKAGHEKDRSDNYITDDIDRKQLRIDALAKHFFERFDKTGQAPLIITLTNKDREVINDVIRAGLMERQQLSGPSYTATVLSPVPLTEVGRSQASAFKPYQIIRSSFAQPERGIPKGEYFTIKSIVAQDNLVVLENQQGNAVAWKPPSYKTQGHSGVEIYEVKRRQLNVGDQIRWTRSDIERGMLGGENAEVIAIEKHQVTVKTKSNPAHVLDIRDPNNQHWDYAYASTVYSSQAKTSEETIVLAESYHINALNQPNFIVMVSRAKERTTIITDDVDLLLKQVIKNTGVKLSSLEVMGEISAKEQAASSADRSLDRHNGNDPTSLQYLQQGPAIQSQPIEKNKKGIYWDAHWIEEKLVAKMDFVLEQILGKPKAQVGNQYRYGSHQGSLLVTISGDKKGWWKDFQTDEGNRSLLSLIQREKGLSFKDTLRYSAAILGLGKVHPEHPSSLSHRAKVQLEKSEVAKTEAVLTAHQQRMLKIARTIAGQARPAQGTLVEEYLRKHRGITAEIPDTVCYHPHVSVKKYGATFPAMVTKITDETGQLKSIEMVLLDEVTAAKADVKNAKLKYGRQAESVLIDLNPKQKKASLTLVGEGIETSLSVLSAFPNADVKCTLGKGNLKKMDVVKLAENVVLCMDNDLKKWQEDKTIVDVAERLREAGKRVWIAMPPIINDQKTDYNDLLKYSGKDKIITNVQQALPYHHEMKLHVQKNGGIKILGDNVPSATQNRDNKTSMDLETSIQKVASDPSLLNKLDQQKAHDWEKTDAYRQSIQSVSLAIKVPEKPITHSSEIREMPAKSLDLEREI